MTFVAAPGIVHLAAIFSQAGQRVENTFHYRVAGTIDGPKLQAMAQTYDTWFLAHVGLFADAVGLQLIYVRDLTTQNSQTLDFVPATTQDGTRANPLLPNNCTIAIKRQTGLAGRARRGRVYWPGITENMLSDTQTLIGGTASTLAASLDALRVAQLSDNAATEVILHRKLGTGTDVVGYLLTDFTIDSQRRRLPGHNRHH